MENFLNSNASNRNFMLNPNHATIIFKCRHQTKFGEQIRIVGNIEELGSWDPNKAMSMATNTEIYPTWESTGDVTGPVGMEINYKYVIVNESNNTCRWEELKDINNRKFTIASSGIFVLNDEEGSTNSFVQRLAGNSNQPTEQQSDDFNFEKGLSSNFESEDEKDKDEVQSFDCLAYDANQLNGSEKPFFFCMNQKISVDDRIIIASAHLPFEIDKTPDDNYLIRVTDESLIYSILYGMKEKEVCEVVWVGMLRNFSQFNEKDLEKISDFLRDRNIFMINVSETEYRNYWIYMNQILGDVFVSSTVDIHK
jgi:hypothetical protein